MPIITTALPSGWQGVVLHFGDSVPVILGDDLPVVDLGNLVSHPVQRAVVIARLRRWADLIEAGESE